MKDDREGEIRVTERIANVLLKEESSGGSRARLCLDRGSVDVEYLQDCCHRQRVSDTVEGSTKDGPWLQDLILESELVLRRPTPRIRSPELEARLAELRKKREEREYNKLVKVAGHALGEKRREWNDPFEFEGNAGLVTYKQQLGFGMSVITLMGTLFLVGYKAAKHLTEDPSLHSLGGVLGMVIALVMETLVFILKARRLDPRQELHVPYEDVPSEKKNN